MLDNRKWYVVKTTARIYAPTAAAAGDIVHHRLTVHPNQTVEMPQKWEPADVTAIHVDYDNSNRR